MVLRSLSLTAGLLTAIAAATPLAGATVDLGRAQECAGPLRFNVRSGGEDRVVDAPAGAATIEVAAGAIVTLAEPQTCWSAPAVVDSERVSLPILKARRVRGSIAASDHPTPASVTVAYRFPRGNAEGVVTETAAVKEDRTFALRLPSAPLDLRVAAARYAPAYFWRFDGEVIPPLKLIAGASVTGWITTPWPMKLPAVTVRILPSTAASASSEPEDRTLRARRTQPNEEGFFQIAGLEEGTWSLVVEAEQLSTPHPLELELSEGVEEMLRAPLVLMPAGSLSVVVSPPLQPDGTPWSIDLQRRVPLSSYTKKVAEAQVAHSGHWMFENLAGGEYVVRILGPRDAVATRAEVELSAGGTAHVDLTVETVSIEGRVATGDTPLRASLRWHTNEGERTTLESDADGRFAGTLPRAGTWYIDVLAGSVEYLRRRRVEVEAGDDGRARPIEIRVPGGVVRGRVTDRNGRPASGAVHLFRGLAGVREAAVGDDGTFELKGLEEGLHAIRAENGTAMSSLTPVSVSESSPADVVLIVDEKRKVNGWLTTPDGVPLAGAQIWYWSPETALAPAQSGPSGTFSLTLPEGASSVQLAVVTPSRPSKLIAMPLPPKHERLHVTVGREQGRIILRSGDMPPYPYVFSRGAAASLLLLLRRPSPGMPPEWGVPVTGEMMISLEPGVYELCDSPQRNRCVVANVHAGSSVVADLTSLWRSE